MANFISLVQSGFYKNVTFHRVLKGFMAQGGDPTGSGAGGPGYSIPDECHLPNHREHFRGSLSMAKTGPDTAARSSSSCFVPTPQLDGKHTVFGRVISGMDVLAKIQRRDPHDKEAPRPDKIIEAKVTHKRGNKTVYEIGVELKNVKDKHAVALAVGVELGLNPDNLYNLMANPPSNLTYLILANYVDEDKALSLEQIKITADQQTSSGEQSSLSGLEFTPHPQRTYPEGALASNVIGFVSHEGRGYFGIEEKYNDLLAGSPVQVKVPVDPNQAADIPQVPNGTTLILTLNRDLQAATEQILDNSITKYGVAMLRARGELPCRRYCRGGATCSGVASNRAWDNATLYFSRMAANSGTVLPDAAIFFSL